MYRFALALAAVAMVASPTFAAGTRCRDAKGKFIKCPPKAAPAAAKKCRDAKGHFAKCGAPGTKPA